jgi:hypothetical protein
MKLIVGAIALLSMAQPASWPLADARLALTSLGPVRIGMSEAAVRRVVQGDISETPVGAPECVQSSVRRDPGIVFMFERNTLTRIDLADAHHFTLSGLRVGDTEDRARELYLGRFEESPHKYLEEGHYLTLRSADKRHALVIETDGRFVTRLRAGVVPSVEYVEGCS